MKTTLINRPDSDLIRIDFDLDPDGLSLRLLPAELSRPPKPYAWFIDDLSTKVEVTYGGLRVYDTTNFDMGKAGWQSVSTVMIPLDVERFFQRALELREKGIRTHTTDTRRFSTQQPARPGRTVMELLRHPNTRDITDTLKHFARRLRKEYWPKLMADLSRLADESLLFGRGDEFFFNGRIPNGCGYVGGVILHGDEFSIHT